MSDSKVIVIKQLSKKATNDQLRNIFGLYGTISHIGSYDDNDGMHLCAEITFDSSEQAAKAVAEMNGKQLMGKIVSIELRKANTSKSLLLIQPQMTKEEIGGKVYPLAKSKYESQAAKITGMLVESMMKRKASDIRAILNSQQDLNDLIDSAHTKLQATSQ